MARFIYDCPEHGQFRVSLVKRERSQPCKECGVDSKPVLTMGTVQVVERLDNGAMVRAVERLHNVEEIMSDRSKKHSAESKARRGID